MQNMTEPEAREFVGHNKFGLLSLAEGGKAYAVPLFYGYDGRDLYLHMLAGLKTEYIRATDEACFTIVRVMGPDDWASVQVFGRLEELGDGPDRIAALDALMAIPLPPEFGESSLGEPRRGNGRAAAYRLRPRRLSGRYSQRPRLREGDVAMRGM